MRCSAACALPLPLAPLPVPAMLTKRYPTQVLTLGHNGLGDAGTMHLFEYLSTARDARELESISLNTNAIGDAGLGASLDDMIAWERHIDATRDDAGSLYCRLSAPVCFADGAPAVYGFGLNRGTELGRPVTAHGGALRGWRSHRMYVPSERVSVVVMFNHLADAHEAAVDLLAAVLGVSWTIFLGGMLTLLCAGIVAWRQPDLLQHTLQDVEDPA